MTWEICWILMQAVENLKWWTTLMGYFCWKYAMFELKKYRGAVLWKMTYGFENNKTNFEIWWTSSWKLGR